MTLTNTYVRVFPWQAISDRLLADSELRYPYDGSKTLMHVFDRFEDTDLIAELLNGMHAELPEKKPKKTK